MARRTSRTPRDLLVWLHVISSVGTVRAAHLRYDGQRCAAAQCVLHGRTTGRAGARRVRQHLRVHRVHAVRADRLGLLPALVGAGEVRDHRRTAVRRRLRAQRAARRRGTGRRARRERPRPATGRADGADVLRDRVPGVAVHRQARQAHSWAGAAKPPTAPAWHFGVAAAVPVLDYLLGTFVLGKPLPALSLLVAIGYPIWRSARLRVEVQGRVRAVP